MDIFEKHEMFEIEVLEKLKNSGFLGPLVFAGGTMLRLCFELNRYSSDLDFWFIRSVNKRIYFTRLKKYLSEFYELTDSQMKYNTLLFEIRSENYPKRLKIEIRQKVRKCDYEEIIAFSKYANKQVILKAHTLEQMMKNKTEAGLARKDIRDFFDIEFLLRQGIPFNCSKSKLVQLKNIAANFKDRNFKVTLGSLLEQNLRKYYIKNKFIFLINRINQKLGEASR